MQGPRSIPPGRRSYHRPPQGGRKAGPPERIPSRAPKGRGRGWPRQREETAGSQPPPPVPTHWIYLHGFGSSPRSQKAAFFERKFAGVNLPFVVPDLNVPTFENLTMTAMLEKVDEVIGALPPDARVGIVGSSLGGLLALFAAERHADRVTRLFLMAPALALFRSNFVGMGRVGMKRWEREGYVEVHHYGTERTERLSYEFVRDAHRYDESKVNLHLPILIVHGTHDETVDPHLSVLYAKRNPNVRLHLVEDDHTLIASCTEMWEWLWREIRPKQPGSAEA